MLKPRIHTYTRRWVNPLDVRPTDICIEDIAHALALLNRFVGHTRRPISIAQHSVYVARLAEDAGHGLQGLLHDGSEAYLGDVSAFLKKAPEMAPYRRAEASLQRKIYRAFGCAPKTHPAVEMADKLMVRFEGTRGYDKDWIVEHPAYPRLTAGEIASVGEWGFWSWREAERVFLDEYRRLRGTN